MTLRCGDLLRLLNAHVDGEVDPAVCGAFRRHLEGWRIPPSRGFVHHPLARRPEHGLRPRMHVEQGLRLVAGVFVSASVILAVLHSPWWFVLTGFVGLNLLQSGLTNWCPMMALLKKLGLPPCRS